MTDELKTTLEENSRVSITASSGRQVARVTKRNADHLFELEPTGITPYAYLQVDLREPATLHGYHSAGAGYEETGLGEIESMSGIDGV